MGESLGADWARAWITASAEVLAENRVALITLDREIGDGDHGENLERGFSAVRAKLASQPEDATPGALLKMVATTLISTVGGASGPLLGTAFLKGAGALGDATEIDSAGVAAFVAAARDGAVLRGKAEVGDKTMVDALVPLSDTLSREIAGGATLAAAWRSAADATTAAAEATKDLLPRMGRARPHAEKSLGTPDAGAYSLGLIMQSIAAVLAENKEDNK